MNRRIDEAALEITLVIEDVIDRAQREDRYAAMQREREIIESAYADYFEEIKRIGNHLDTIPHCDDLILHGPGVCDYCDKYPAWQEARRKFRIEYSFTQARIANHRIRRTGYRPCPASVLRPIEKIERWGGNVPYNAEAEAGDVFSLGLAGLADGDHSDRRGNG
jgi:hypothetical protein